MTEALELVLVETLVLSNYTGWRLIFSLSMPLRKVWSDVQASG